MHTHMHTTGGQQSASCLVSAKSLLFSIASLVSPSHFWPCRIEDGSSLLFRTEPARRWWCAQARACSSAALLAVAQQRDLGVGGRKRRRKPVCAYIYTCILICGLVCVCVCVCVGIIWQVNTLTADVAAADESVKPRRAARGRSAKLAKADQKLELQQQEIDALEKQVQAMSERKDRTGTKHLYIYTCIHIQDIVFLYKYTCIHVQDMCDIYVIYM